MIKLIKFFFIALLYFLAGNFSLANSSDNSIVTLVIFFAEGISLAGAILYGAEVWIGVLVGQFALAYYNGMSWQPSLGIAIVNSLEVILAVYFFKKFRLNKNLSTFRDLFGLMLMIIFILQPFSSLLGNLVLLQFHIIEATDYLKSVIFWFVGNVLGQLLVAPMLLLMYHNITKKDINRVIIVTIVTVIMSYLFFKIYPITNSFLLLGLTVFLTLFLSYQMGVHYGAFVTVIISIISLYLTQNGIGVFIDSSYINNIINFNSYFLFQILLVLLFGTLLSDMKNQADNLKKLVEKEMEKNRQQQFHMLQQNRLSLKGEMISMIAHQWKQPLNNLSLINQVLILHYEDGKLDDKVIEEFERDSFNQIEQMTQTISDFTNFFSPEINSREFYIKDVVVKSLEFLQPILKKESIKVDSDIDNNRDISLVGYPNELGQVIINIINNAKDVLIERRAENREIYIKTEITQKNIHLFIEDNAGGIPANIIGKIFDPYFSTKSKNGTGLGLYMSKMIIE
jgi:signal transduction histidine kinase